MPRAGAIVTRGFQRTRWFDGRVYTWLGRQKQTGRGQGASGLVFDRAADGKRLRCTFNLSGSPAGFAATGNQLFSVGDLDGGELGPYAAVIEEIA